MARLLVTGGAGFIGANFLHYWRAAHPEDFIVVLDALTYAGNRASLTDCEGKPQYRFVEGDIVEQSLVEQLLREQRLDHIVHFAAESHVDRSILGPDAFLRTNIDGTHSLLKAARQVWLTEAAQPLTHRFHHVSTDEVYGTLSPDEPAFSETTAYAPNSPYAASKAASDHLVRAYHHTYGLQVTTSNCSNNYGPFHFPEKLLPLMLVNCLLGKPLPVYGDGRQIRDWLYVEDHCRGIERVLQSGCVGETYNIGGNSEVANIDLVQTLCDQLDARFANDASMGRRYPDAPPASGESCRSLIRHVADRPGHDRRYAINAGKIRGELDFAPNETLQTGLSKTIDWYLAHADWWQPLLDRRFQVDWQQA